MDIDSKLVLGALKPAGGFIDALLASKLDKVKLWAEERDLKGKLEPEVLSKVLDSYLNKISKRVSEITTISFPLQKLNIFDAYEPLFIELIESGGQVRYPLEVLLTDSVGALLIIDNAGMGKSTFSKYFVSQVLLKSERIPLFYELRKLKKDDSLIDELAKELDALGKSFSRGLFYELIKLGKFIVVLDGFDEVDLDFQEDLSNQILDLSLNGGDNKLLLTSRPQESLPELINCTAYKFSHFTRDQAVSLVLRYDLISKLDVGARLINGFDAVPEKFIETPLLVSLLYRTFGTNNSIADRVCTFYDEIYHALYKGHDLINKNGYVRQKKSGLDFEDFRRLLRAFCYYMAVSKKTSFESWSEVVLYIDKASKMSSINPSSATLFLDDLLTAVPLMQREGTEYKFLHKTILEFFAAEYIIFRSDSFDICSKIFDSRQFSSFNKVFDFIFDISPQLFDRVVTGFHARKMLSLIDSSDDRVLLLNSLLYLRDAKFGLWEVGEFSKEIVSADGVAKRVLDLPDHLDDFNNGYFSTSWIDLKVEGKEYLVAFTVKDRLSKMHSCAWNQISDVISIDDYNKNNGAEVLCGIEKNQWQLLSSDLIEKLVISESVIGLACRALKSFRLGVEDDELRVFSPNKAHLILDRICSEGVMDEEINDLLV